MKDVREALMIRAKFRGQACPPAYFPVHARQCLPVQISRDVHSAPRYRLCAWCRDFAADLWLVCAASGDGAFSVIQAFFASWIGLLILFGFTVALFYHFCNGIRHLAWDAGKRLELPDMHRNGKLVFVATIILTVVFWVIAFWCGEQYE